MFINDRVNDRTIDIERGIELRYLGSGADRPTLLAMVVDGVPIAVDATVRTVIAPDGTSGLSWTVHAIGRDRSFYGVPPYTFANETERGRLLRLLDEALRVYRDLTGRIKTPVVEVSFNLSDFP